MSSDLLRLDTATALRRFWHLERALIVALGGWVPSVARLETKALLAESAWLASLTAHELRERVFELRYPDRALVREPDRSLVDLFEGAVHAPSPRGFLSLIGELLFPSLRAAHERYLELSDPIADGPSHRFLAASIRDKQRLEQALADAATSESGDDADGAWLEGFAAQLRVLGGVPVEAPVTREVAGPTPARRYSIPDDPVRDPHYALGRFYWPDNFDPDFPYGEGTRLRLRTALSHLNEVWAVETAGAILFELGPGLGWEFIRDAARWLYDESRHMTMGKVRLERWGIKPVETPLGSFIYRSCAGQPVSMRLAMLAFFETKNIGKKAQRAASFGTLGDRDSQRDMEFDWADEAIHAGYGRRWLREAVASEGGAQRDWAEVVAEAERLVAREIASAPREEKERTRALATALIGRVERLL